MLARKYRPVKRAKLVYFAALGGALGLCALAATLTLALTCNEWPCALFRFLVLIAAGGSAVVAWGTAIMIASFHKVAWPFWLMVAVVVMSATAFAATAHRLDRRRSWSCQPSWRAVRSDWLAMPDDSRPRPLLGADRNPALAERLSHTSLHRAMGSL
jgi:hypothetical protein